MKYVNAEVVLREVPTEISLAFNISGCPFRCDGCHSVELRQDIGETFDEYAINKEILKHPGISCLLFMGGDVDRHYLYNLSKKFRHKYKIAWYSGSNDLDVLDDSIPYFDYIKIGSWKKDRGPLNSPTTNQRLYKVEKGTLIDITNKMQIS
jgi:anaerobic ribonucleoside-triphosphate reductase activating protein